MRQQTGIAKRTNAAAIAMPPLVGNGMKAPVAKIL
jgi:hypothetical protein